MLTSTLKGQIKLVYFTFKIICQISYLQTLITEQACTLEHFLICKQVQSHEVTSACVLFNRSPRLPLL